MQSVLNEFLNWMLRFLLVAFVLGVIIQFGVLRRTSAVVVDREQRNRLRAFVRGSLLPVALMGLLLVIFGSEWPAVAGLALMLAALVVGVYWNRVSFAVTHGEHLPALFEGTAVEVAAGESLETALATVARSMEIVAPRATFGPAWQEWLRDHTTADSSELAAGINTATSEETIARLLQMALIARQGRLARRRSRLETIGGEVLRPWVWCVVPASYVIFFGPMVQEGLVYLRDQQSRTRQQAEECPHCEPTAGRRTPTPDVVPADPD